MGVTPLASALALLRQGRADLAEPTLRGLLAQNPADGEARHVLGLVLLALNRPADALRQFSRSLDLSMDSAPLRYNRANALAALGRWAEAERDLARAVALDPAMAAAWFNRATAYRQLDRQSDAITCLTQALQLRPDFGQALFAFAEVRLERGETAMALELLERLQQLQPDDAQVSLRRGICLHLLGRLDEARACFEGLLARQPDLAEAWNTLGNLQYDQRELEQALASLDRALALAPDLVEAHNNRGMVLRDLARLPQARSEFERALELRPGYPEALRRRGALNLTEGRFAEGWADYQAANRRVRQNKSRATGLPFWEGQDLAGKSILLSEPSGLGDTLQFMRFIPRLLALGARVAFTGPPSMFRLMSRFDAGLELVEAPEYRRYDFQCWLMDLPHWLGLAREEDFRASPYLSAEPERIARWASSVDPARLNVGICWQGNPGRKMDSSRSIPLLDFLPLAAVPGIRLVCLQKQFGLEQVPRARAAGLDLQVPADFDEGSDAFLDSAGLLGHLDLLVSADSSLTHLAGALGRPAWLALNQVPDWRWMLGRTDSPWYASVRLFRQDPTRSWRPVFESMAEALRPMAAARLRQG